jgi:hypothetical protein
VIVGRGEERNKTKQERKEEKRMFYKCDLCSINWYFRVLVYVEFYTLPHSNLGLIPGRSKRFSSPPDHPDWLWGLNKPPVQWLLRAVLKVARLYV